MSVWIRLPRLPMEYYDEVVCKGIGNYLGKFMKIDVFAWTTSRGRFARICIEVDLELPLIPNVTINYDCFAVEYESLHEICFLCGKFGHNKEAYPNLQAEPPPVMDHSSSTPLARRGSLATHESEASSSTNTGSLIA
ncbi:hypothetical protein Scep_027462 [Stephania cephalantha]|uniref:DUF4283 domain-containing protein n=1 Tax=Stephania cephalantha TaxID=152367 RepID=A0AAP0HMK1_9MAGN